MPALLWYLNNRLVKLPPKGSVLVDAFKVVRTGLSQPKIQGEAFYESAKPVSVLSDADSTVSPCSKPPSVSPSFDLLFTPRR